MVVTSYASMLSPLTHVRNYFIEYIIANMQVTQELQKRQNFSENIPTFRTL